MADNKWKFSIEKWGDRWFPHGRGPNEEEIWSDGCCVSDKRLAQMVAMNMEQAFKAGWDAALNHVETLIHKDIPIVHSGFEIPFPKDNNDE